MRLFDSCGCWISPMRCRCLVRPVARAALLAADWYPRPSHRCARSTEQSCKPDSDRAVDILRRDYARKIRVEELAAAAGMSEPVFHRHFRAITSLSPLQFQKQLRLIEARRLMLSEGTQIAQAANAVGYASIPQFTREYRRLFDAPPGKDIRLLTTTVRAR